MIRQIPRKYANTRILSKKTAKDSLRYLYIIVEAGIFQRVCFVSETEQLRNKGRPEAALINHTKAGHRVSLLLKISGRSEVVNFSVFE